MKDSANSLIRLNLNFSLQLKFSLFLPLLAARLVWYCVPHAADLISDISRGHTSSIPCPCKSRAGKYSVSSCDIPFARMRIYPSCPVLSCSKQSQVHARANICWEPSQVQSIHSIQSSPASWWIALSTTQIHSNCDWFLSCFFLSCHVFCHWFCFILAVVFWALVLFWSSLWILTIYRKMFIGGLNWETTDRTFQSKTSWISLDGLLISITHRITSWLLLTIWRSSRMYGHARQCNTTFSRFRFPHIPRSQDREHCYGEGALSRWKNCKLRHSLSLDISLPNAWHQANLLLCC